MTISAIVPVYNSEKYIKRCIDSIIEQSYQNWELICVDDGSCDNSLKILEEYSNNDSRIRVIHKENGGPGSARNVGIEVAKGDYIVFVDSDDRIKNDYFEKLSVQNSDVVFIDVDHVDHLNKLLRKEYMSKYKNMTMDEIIRSQLTGKIPWGGVRKAAKTELIRKNRIRFSEHKIGEEAIYSFLLMHYGKSFSFIEGSVYEYIARNGSQSDSKDDDPWGRVALSLKERVIQLDLYSIYADTINAFITTAAIVSLDKMTSYYSGLEYRSKAINRIKRYREEIDRNYGVDVNHMPQKAKVLYPFLRLGLYKPIQLASCVKQMRK